MSTNSEDEYRPSSKQRKLTTTPLSEIFESSELLPRRKNDQSPKKKRRSPSKLTKDEIKYQRFVHDLKKDIQVYMKQCMRESRFDTRDNQCSKTNSSFRPLRATLKPKQAPSSLSSYRNHEIETIISSVSNRQDPMSFLKYNQTKRLAADVQTILTGPAMKSFYTQFIRPLPQQQPSIPHEELLLKCI